MLWRALKHVEAGFYVDVGANDPVEDSVTKAFYDYGWSGINIEPVAGWYEKLCEQRQRDINLQVAAGDYDGELRLFEVVDTGLSTTNEAYASQHAEEHGYTVHQLKVPVQTLSTILSHHTVTDIHFLKIDVEGSERFVLKGLDLSSFRPWIIVIEATKPMTATLDFEIWESLLTQQNYSFVYFDGINRFYLSNEHPELAQAFAVPPNLWDRYQRISEYEAHESITALEENVRALKAELVLQERSKQSLERSQQTLDKALHELINSRSMKVTAPLRKGLDIARKVKRSPKSLSRKLIKVVVEHPQLRRIAKPIVNKFPTLQYRLSYFFHSGNPDIVRESTQLDDSDLSARSTRILKDIQQTLQQ